MLRFLGIWAVLGLCLAGPGSADPPALRIERHGDGPLRLLWIGNSHTARHAIAAQVAAMAPGAVSITVVTMNGAAVAETLARDAAARLFARPEWDVVVLQDWSWHAMRRPDALHATPRRPARLAQPAQPRRGTGCMPVIGVVGVP